MSFFSDKTTSLKNKILIGFVLFAFLLVGFFVPLYQAKAQEKNPTQEKPTVTAGEVVGQAVENMPIVQAGKVLTNPIGMAINWFANELVKAIAWVAGIWFIILAVILDIILWLYNNVLFAMEEYTTVPVVRDGWKLILDFTNIFFALVLLIIAFASILGKEEYGVKKLLPKLIIAALLINFSLVICGLLIDFSQVFMHHFIPPDVGTRLKEGLNIAKLTGVEKEASFAELTKGAGAGAQKIVIAVVTVVFGILIMLGAIGVLFAGVFIILWRMFMLWILLIFAPLAWLCSILPYTEKYYKQWWENFIQQCLIGPVYFFFIYLTTLLIGVQKDGKFENIFTSIGDKFKFESGLGLIAETDSVAAKIGQTLGLTAGVIMQYIFILFFMGMGVMAAQAVGGNAAASALKAVDKARGGIGKWAKTKMAERPLQTIARTGAFQTMGRALAKVPGAKYLGKTMLGASEASRAVLEKDIRAAKEKMKPWKTENLVAYTRRAGGSEAVAGLSMIAQRDKDGDPDAKREMETKEYQDKMKIADKFGKAGEILEMRPDLAPAVGKNISQVVAELKDISKMSASALANAQVQTSLLTRFQPDGKGSVNELKNSAADPALYANIIKNILIPSMSTLKGDIQEYIRKSPAKGLLPPGVAPTRRRQAAMPTAPPVTPPPAAPPAPKIEVVTEGRGPIREIKEYPNV